MVIIMPNINIDWLALHTQIDKNLTAEVLASNLVKVGIEEEKIHSSGVSGPIVIGKILQKKGEKQTNGKLINWCYVDVGKYNTSDGNRGIICGANNFEVGDKVIVALPGSVLPNNFVITARKTYGHISDGMICSANELGLADKLDNITSDGIIVVDKTNEKLESLKIGEDVKESLQLTKELLEVNITPDRGYCFSYRGIGREYSLSTNAKFIDRAKKYIPSANYKISHKTDDFFKIVDKAPINNILGCGRFVGLIVKNVDNNLPSPKWLQNWLIDMGMRPINLIVDVANFVMLDLGQPLHTYNLDELKFPIIVRRAKKDETLKTLDNVNRILDKEDLLITDNNGSRIIGLAGVMGGESTQIDNSSNNVFIEAAYFDPVTIARSAKRHKLSSEASKRFERGVDTNIQINAAFMAAQLIAEYGSSENAKKNQKGVQIQSTIYDLNLVKKPQNIIFPLNEIPRIIGLNIDSDIKKSEIISILEKIGCVVKEEIRPKEKTKTNSINSRKTSKNKNIILKVAPPTWRPDLTIPADLCEEIARVWGYDKIPVSMPLAQIGPGLPLEMKLIKRQKDLLANFGLTETYSYPFVGQKNFQDLYSEGPYSDIDNKFKNAIKLVNPLQDKAPYLRTSILQTLLYTCKFNYSRGLDNISLYEISQIAKKSQPSSKNNTIPKLSGGKLPSKKELSAIYAASGKTQTFVAGVLSGNIRRAGWWGSARSYDWADCFELVDKIGKVYGVSLKNSKISNKINTKNNDKNTMPYHPGISAKIATFDDQLVGYMGQIHPQVAQNIKFDNQNNKIFCFELNLNILYNSRSSKPLIAKQISLFPPARQDLAFVVDKSLKAKDLINTILKAAKNYEINNSNNYNS
ncbi:MAG: phenylalanine--tRNA ligase subunit beta, partial [Bifidobacteriaceae bacterium]|nr:phenylalanine--tRNA ligase subunit beta [Bifidobacteriaceae bacterium]